MPSQRKGIYHILTLLIFTVMLPSIIAQPEPVWTDNCINVNQTSGTCLQCIDGFYLEYFLCLPCSPLCNCISQYNYCTSCITISYKNSSFNKVPLLAPQATRCNLCETFISYCLTCTSQIYCTSCFGGYYPVESNSKGQIISICSTVTCQPNCQVCKDSTQCSLCVPGYYLDTQTNLCSNSLCRANCTQCLSDTDCKYCDPGFYLDSKSKDCKSCQIEYCLVCSNTSNCQNCTAGYYSTGTACNSTGFSNCVLYTGGAAQASACQVCEPGYFVLYSNCFQCVGCQLCSLQFLCQSPCLANATSFNYACLVPFTPLSSYLLTSLGVFSLILISWL